MTVSILCAAISFAPHLNGMQFHSRPGKVFVEAKAAAKALGWAIRHDSVLNLTEIEGRPVPVDQPRLFNGSLLLEKSELPTGRIEIRIGPPRVIVDLTRQTITAWQGSLMVMHTAISSGRTLKDTPPGSYKTGLKEAMHISSIYGSKMPFSVHLRGNYFIHGSDQTQSGPGSHGCIRLPMHNDAAKWFFDWVAPGAPVKVHGKRPITRTK